MNINLIPVGKDEQEEFEGLTDSQLEQCDLVNGVAYQAICDITGGELPWNMEWIGEVSDVLVQWAMRLTGRSEMELYPYLDEEENM